jgi:hypothetical protein
VGDGKISAVVVGVGGDKSDHEGEDESDGEHGGSGAKEKGGRVITTVGMGKFQKKLGRFVGVDPLLRSG